MSRRSLSPAAASAAALGSLALHAYLLASSWRVPCRAGRSGPSQEAAVGLFGDVETWLQDKQEEFRARRERIKEVCESEPVGSAAKRKLYFSSSFLVEKYHGLLYCDNAKVASSTLKRHMFQLSGVPRRINYTEDMDSREFHTLVTRYMNAGLKRNGKLFHPLDLKIFSERPWVDGLMFVRHPFERLVSAFEDKVLRPVDDPWPELARRLNGSFRAFADHVAADHAACGGDGGRAGCRVNRHWRPYHVRCGPCYVSYEFVGRAETFSDDLRYIWMKKGLGDVIAMEKTLSVSNHIPHSADRAKRYFAQLSPGQRRALYDLYDVDFRMFGYSADGYL